MFVMGGQLIEPNRGPDEDRRITRSMRKRVLFPSEYSASDDMSDLRPLSSSDDSSVCSLDLNQTDDDVINSSCLSPSIHRGIENLFVLKEKNMLNVNNDEDNSFSSPTEHFTDLEYDLVKETDLTPRDKDKLPVTVYGTPQLPITSNDVNAPLKNTSISSIEAVIEAENGIKPSVFYGCSAMSDVEYINAIRSIRSSKVKTKLFDENREENEISKTAKSSKKSSNYKKTPPLFTGVGHGIRKQKMKKLSKQKSKSTALDKLRKQLKNSRMLKNQKWDSNLWNVPKRVEIAKEVNVNRKFFKSTVSADAPKRKNCEEDEIPQKKFKFTNTRDLLELLADDSNDYNSLQDNVNNIIDNFDYLCDESSTRVSYVTKKAADSVTYKMQQMSYLTPALTGGVSFEERNSFNNTFSDKKSKSNYSDVLSLDINLKDNRKRDDSKLSDSTNKMYYPVFNSKASKSLSNDPLCLADQTTTLNKLKRDKLRKAAMDENQSILDAGQKSFGATQCQECKMVYQISNVCDEERHAKFHDRTDVLKHKKWKNENIVGHCNVNGRVILVRASDPKSHIQKVMDILKHTEDEIGSCCSFNTTWQAYLYVHDNLILGCLIAEPLNYAYPSAKEDDILLHAEEPCKVKCGINRIWTHPAYRKRGIATALVNCLRKNFVYGIILTIEDIAFSATTDAGHAFAKKYAGNNYLVYTGIRIT